ncbi:mechanosensitive ion channel family protein [Paraburkholderia sp.]|uniref:mechanosensitive ion channel family protein n=1 Tax=Paraburkholderia sp. TaxID=1926495 RepID=UPI002F3F878F
MRKILLVCLLILFAAPAFAATTTATAPASAPVTLTPDQARQALEVLNNPQQRAQIEDTLHAIVAAGALAAPPASAATAASAPAVASGASAAAHTAFQSNGLASQLARQGAHWAVQTGITLERTVSALLDVSSVRAWWADLLHDPARRTTLRRVALTLLGALVPAWVLEWLARRLLRRAVIALGERRAQDSYDPNDSLNLLDLREPTELAQPAPDQAAGSVPDATASTSAGAGASATAAATSPAPHSNDMAGKANAAHHWSLLRRLPRAILRTLVRCVPLLVFIGAASLLMSILTTDDTPQDRALDAIIDIYVINRLIVILGNFFLQPDAPRLRLLRMNNTWAAFTQRWIVAIVSVVGAGDALAQVAVSVGLSEAANLALMKVIALVGHVMLSILVLQSSAPVAARIRQRFERTRSLSVLGSALADAWAWITVFIVMALWFVWALNVHNGYETLLHLGGISIGVLVAARVVAIVMFGALAKLFNAQDGQVRDSLVHQRAYRYYPLVRRLVSWVIGVVTMLLLLQVWGVDVGVLFQAGSIGHRLASALVTIGVAAVVALFVWEATNVTVERRLHQWTTAGDLVRAARLRTLLPMLRSALFIAIALIVVLTGLSELGVNIGPLLAGASIFGVALGFGSQKLVQDFITGIFLLTENAMQVGDWVTLAGVSGTVEYLSIRTVRLRGGDGSLYTVPFSSVSTVNNTNRGLGNAAVKVSIPYGEDVERATATLKEIGTALRDDPAFKDAILSDFAFWGVDSVDGASVTLTGQIQCRDSGRWGVQREFNRRVAELFQQRGIQIANPQRTVLIPGGAGAPVAAEQADSAANVPQAKPDGDHKTSPEHRAAGDAEASSDAPAAVTDASKAANRPAT